MKTETKKEILKLLKDIFIELIKLSFTLIQLATLLFMYWCTMTILSML